MRDSANADADRSALALLQVCPLVWGFGEKHRGLAAKKWYFGSDCGNRVKIRLIAISPSECADNRVH